MTELQILRSKALASLPLDGWDASFAKSMGQLAELRAYTRLTERQAFCIAKLSWRYRSRMPAYLVPAQDPDPQNNSWTFRPGDSHTEPSVDQSNP